MVTKLLHFQIVPNCYRNHHANNIEKDNSNFTQNDGWTYEPTINVEKPLCSDKKRRKMYLKRYNKICWSDYVKIVGPSF